jgi:uncharacterized protein YlaI
MESENEYRVVQIYCHVCGAPMLIRLRGNEPVPAYMCNECQLVNNMM